MSIGTLAILALTVISGVAQDGAVSAAPAAPVSPVAPAAMAGIAADVVPARTVIELEIMQALGSKTSKAGDRFAIRLAEPLVIAGRTVLPAGLTGEGEVVHAAKARWGGKAGELVLAARYLECGARSSGVERRIALGYFKFGMAGQSRTAEALFVPFVGPFIGGGEVSVAPGTRANAQTKDIIELPGSADMACPAPVVSQTAAAGEGRP